MSDRSRGRPGRARKLTTLVGALAIAAPLLSACGSSDDGIIINLYGGAAATGFDKIIAACNEKAGGKYTIVGNLLPSDADSQREQLVRRLAANDTGMDILGMDVTWTAEFAEAKWIREWTGANKEAATKDILQPPIDTATWKDKLYGAPKHTNVQLLWYRKSLVPEVPKTWDEMLTMAEKLKSEDKPYVIGFTGRQYEGYVVGFNTILNSYGGELVDADGKVAINDKTTEALELLKKFATSGVASASLSNSTETEVYADMEAGRAAFILNWPYVLSAMRGSAETNPAVKEVLDDLAYAPYPSIIEGEEPKVTLGGMNFAVSTYSEHPDEAYEAALCMREPEMQLMAALDAGDVPANETLYEDPEFQEAYPMYEEILTELKVAVPRPKTPLYQNVSTIVSSTLSPPSSIDPKADTAELKQKIEDAIAGKGILP